MTPKQFKELYLQEDHVLEFQDYQQAIDAQNAINASGLIFSLGRVMEKINKEATERNQGGTFRNSHPILRMYLEQLTFLCGYDLDEQEAHGLQITECEKAGMPYMTAYDICMEKARLEDV
jgi:hypothetical protein